MLFNCLTNYCNGYKPIEVIKNKLYWISSKNTPQNVPQTFYFNIDTDLVYEPFFSDFGPFDIVKTCNYVLEVKKLLTHPKFAHCKLYHHTSTEETRRANAAFLMGAFQIIILSRTAEEAWEPFSTIQPPFLPFRDVLIGKCDYKCLILDCLKGIEAAIKLRWFDIRKFNLKAHEYYAKIENGDLTWIIPGKFIAFSGPLSTSKDEEGHTRFTPEDYAPIFKKLGVKMIVRLNDKEYDEERFKKNGFEHKDIQCSKICGASNEAIEEFLQVCAEQKGVIAVHCKSGLGVTGVMIGCYAMKHYGFEAASFIGWMRICRPGSIFGRQQQFLVDKESSCRRKSSKSGTDFDEPLIDEEHVCANAPIKTKPLLLKLKN